MEKRIELEPYRWRRFGTVIGIIGLLFWVYISIGALLAVGSNDYNVGRVIIFFVVLCIFVLMIFVLFITSDIKIIFTEDGLQYISRFGMVLLEPEDIAYAYFCKTSNENILVLSPSPMEKGEINKLFHMQNILWKYLITTLKPQKGKTVIISFLTLENNKHQVVFDYIYEKYRIKP